ncbi:MAG: aminotransferase class III-fold pyridoxal phosphate-dependent enzyme [Bacillota bacterium]
MTGFGRTGTWFAYQQYGVTLDIMTLGKGLSSSALPVSAVVLSREAAETFSKWRWST